VSPDLESLKHGPADSGVEDLILKRWSPRSFTDKPVSNEDLKKIFTAAAWAPSSSNEQPWRFLIGHKGDPTYSKIFASLVEFNQLWAKTAPVLILSVGKRTFTKDGSPNAWHLHDTGAALGLPHPRSHRPRHPLPRDGRLRQRQGPCRLQHPRRLRARRSLGARLPGRPNRPARKDARNGNRTPHPQTPRGIRLRSLGQPSHPLTETGCPRSRF
jgi:hypothetical protein